LNDAWELLGQAYREGDHVVLGYSTWAEYVVGEYPIRPQLAEADRGEVFGKLRADGMSNREIAATTGAARNTVNGTEFVEPVPRSTSSSNAKDVDHGQDQQVAQIEPLVDHAAADALAERQAAKDEEVIREATAPTAHQVRLSLHEEMLRLRDLVRKVQRTSFKGQREEVHQELAGVREVLDMLEVLVNAEPVSDESIYEWMGEK